MYTSITAKLNMSYVPYIPDIELWKNHFTNTPAKYKPFYIVKKIQKGSGIAPSVNLVTPTEQVVQQAKAQLKQQKIKPAKQKVNSKQNKARKGFKTSRGATIR